jgi:hypothetical protein
VDSIFPSAYEYVYNRAPEDFCHGKSKTYNFFSLTKLKFNIYSFKLDITGFDLYNYFNAFKFAMDAQLINDLTGVKINNKNIVSFYLLS